MFTKICFAAAASVSLVGGVAHTNLCSFLPVIVVGAYSKRKLIESTEDFTLKFECFGSSDAPQKMSSRTNVVVVVDWRRSSSEAVGGHVSR